MIMKCDICKENDVYITIQQLDAAASTQTEIHLCKDCASERGINPEGERLGMLFSGLMQELQSRMHQFQQSDMRACPVCGKNFSQIKQSLTAGCPECYNVFRDDIKKLLGELGVSGRYTGAMPDRLNHTRTALLPDERVSIQAKLQESVAAEDYERAALYRDRLRELTERERDCLAEDCRA
jgi:protein arginine kinase activator